MVLAPRALTVARKTPPTSHERKPVRTRTATLTRTPVEDSLVALEVAGEVMVKEVRASGLALEASALLIAAQRTRRSTSSIEVRPELLAVLNRPSQSPPPLGLARVLVGIEDLGRDFLARLVPAPVPTDLLQVLQARTPRSRTRTPWVLEPSDAKWVDDNDATVVFTDGSAASRPFQVGTWAYSVLDGPYGSGVLEHVAHSHTAERRAVLEALRATSGPVLVLSDHVFDDRGSPDTLMRLLKVTDELTESFKSRPIRVAHVPAHSTCAGNLVADRLASARLDEALDALLRDPVRASQWRRDEAELTRLESAHKAYRKRREEFLFPKRSALLATRFGDVKPNRHQYREVSFEVDASFPQWPLYLDSY